MTEYQFPNKWAELAWREGHRGRTPGSAIAEAAVKASRATGRAEASHMVAARQAIRGYLASHPGATRKDIHQATGLNADTTRFCLEFMVRHGQVEKRKADACTGWLSFWLTGQAGR